MSYTIKQTDRYNSFSADEQSQIQSAGQSEYDRYFKEASGVYGDNAQIRGSAQEVGQRAAESAFTKFDQQKSQAQMANDVAQSNAFNNWTAQNPNAASVPTQFDPQGTYQTVNGTLTNKSSVQQAAATQAAVAAGTMKAVPLTGAGQTGTGYVQTGGAAEANLANPVNQPTGIPQGGTPAPTAQTSQMSLISQGNLSQGMYDNENVKQLQGLLGITTDGDFGPQTKQAVENFQKANNLTVDGIVGPQTTAALQKLQGGSQTVNDKMLADFQSGKITAEQYNQQAAKMVTDKYQQTLDALKGTTTPSDGGEARNVINSTSPSSSLVPSSSPALDALFTEDKGLQQLIDDHNKYKAEASTSLVDTYKQLEKDAGLQGLDEKLLNLRHIIDGTEDDIRKEVQAASGFATDSQVLALSNARNKQNIKDYNNLVDTKKLATDRINTMVGLTKDDKTNALAKIEEQMKFDEQIMTYKEKFVNNAKEAYNNVIKAVGYDGLYQSLLNSGDSSAVSLAEKTLGLSPGMLQQAATIPDKNAAKDALALKIQQSTLDTDVLQRQQIQSNLLTDKAQRSNIQSQINERNTNNAAGANGTITGKPQTAAQSSANGYADRVAEANIVIDQLGSKFVSKDSIGGSLPNLFQSGDRQAYEQAKRNFVNAVLRRESGAAISPTEFTSAEKQYFPQAGDQAKVIAQKEVSRNTAINNLYREAGVNRPVKPGQIIESGGKKYKVGSDGETLTEIK